MPNNAIDRCGDALLNDEQTAALLNLRTPVTLRVWRSQRRGPPWLKIQGAVRYRLSDLRRHLDGCVVDPAALVGRKGGRARKAA